MEKIIVKKASKNILKELYSVGFDSAYINVAEKKYHGLAYKLFNLKPYEANILKQLALSLGFDCAVSRETITCNCEFTDAILFASNSQILRLSKKLRLQPFRLKKLADELFSLVDNKLSPLNIRNNFYDWSKPYVMGIVNANSDSFSDGGEYNPISKAFQLIEDGADIIDIGGESTRPDATVISVDDEKNRVIPVIKAIRQKNLDIVISVDTRNFETAKSAIEAGADIINDVTGLTYDAKLFDYVVKNNIPVIIMHSDKVPASSQDFTLNDIVDEVYISLKENIDRLVCAGLEKDKIIIDVGIGFGKSKDSCFQLLKRLDEFSSLNCPILLGISRKSFISKQFDLSSKDADIPTALYSSMLPQVNIHRVHNVSLTKKYLDYASLLHD